MEIKKIFQKIIGGKVLVKQVMKKDFVSVGEDQPLHEVANKFVRLHLSHIICTDASGKLSGLVSMKHLYRAQSPRKFIGDQVNVNSKIILDGDAYFDPEVIDSLNLRQIMRRNPLTIRPGQGIDEAIKIMADKNVSCLPVVDHKRKPVGLLFQHDVICYISKILETQ